MHLGGIPFLQAESCSCTITHRNTLGHEITHFIKQYAPKYYETTYKQNVIKALYDQDAGALQRMVKDQIRKAAENGKTQTLVQAMDEVIADTSQTMLFGGEATIKKLVSDNPKLFVRVKRWIDNFVKSIRKAIHNIGPDSEGAKILSKSYDTFKEIQSNYWKAMQEASVNLRGELQAEERSAYEEAHEKAQAAKNAKVGTSVTVPGANKYARPENPINEAMPDAIESRADEAMPDFGAMFADAVDENAMQNMTDDEAQELLSLPNANKLAQERKKPAAKPDFGAMFEASINEDAVKNAPQVVLDIINHMKLPADKPMKPAPAKTPLSELMANKRYSSKFKNLAKKWAANEWVNIDLNKDSQDGYDFLKFASKWYNGGKENLPYPELRVDPMFKEGGMRHTLTYDDHDADYPNFLIDVFYKAGKAEAPDTKTSPKGEKENAGEEVSKQGTVTGIAAELPKGRESKASGSVSVDGTGETSGRILENVSSQDVQPDGDRGDVAQDAADPGADVIRHDASTNAQRPGREPGMGTGQRGDIQPEAGERAGGNNDGLTEDSSEAVTAASDAVEEAHQEIIVSAQSGQNYIIPAEGLDLPSGKKSRFVANINAIKVAKQLEEEGRIATPEEQKILSKYVGWGGIADAFDERPSVRNEWGKEYDELKSILTDDEYKAARASTKNAHYTSIEVIRAMYSSLNQWGFKGGYILEPSVGVGNFIGSAPAFQRQSKWVAVELDHITSLIAKHLYPQAKVHNMGFQEAQFPDNYFDLAIGNVPFGNYGVADKAYPNYLTKSIHNYFFAKSIDKVRPGGLILFITSKYTMDSDSKGVREYLQTKADLLGAVRLPDSAFKDNADTSVVTDILVLKKRESGAPYGGEAFTSTRHEYVNNPYNRYNTLLHTQNEYFVNHPEMVLGEAVPVRGMYGQEIGYKKKGDLPLGQQITDALSTISYKMEYPSRSSVDPVRAAINAIRASSETKNNGLEIKNGKVYQRGN